MLNFSFFYLFSLSIQNNFVPLHRHSDKAIFEILKQSLEGLNDGMGVSLVEAWFLLNTVRASGEEINFHRDRAGEKLKAGTNYTWDVYESAFFETPKGEFGTDEIKVLRLMKWLRMDIIGEKYYIVYHKMEYPRMFEGRSGSRQTCIDELRFDADGNILE